MTFLHVLVAALVAALVMGGVSPARAAQMPGTAGLLTPAQNPPTVALSAANAATSVPSPVIYTETSAMVRTRGAHLSRVADSAAAMSDSITPADSTAFQPYSVTLRTDSVKLDVRFRATGGKYRIWVDGHPISLNPTVAPSGGAFYRVTLTFPTRALREIRFESDATRFASFTVSASDVVSTPDAAGTRAVILGDSFTEGTGANGRFNGYASYLCQMTGWDDCWVSGSGGTGYLANGSPTYTGRKTFRQRAVHDALVYEPDVIVVAGGKNDATRTVAELETEARALFEQIRAALPDVELIVTSPFPSSGTQAGSATYLAMTEALKRSAAGLADSFLDVTGAQAWITGTGRSNAPKGDGTADQYINTDGVHLTPAGHSALAGALFSRYEASLVPADSTAPSVPSDVAASVSGSSVALSWSASSDDVGVSGYSVYRSASSGFTVGSGSLLGSVSGTSFTDADRPAGTWYYRVTAQDAAGNRSGASAEVSAVVVGQQPVVRSLAVTADTYVNAAAASTNFGTSTSLGAYGSPAVTTFLRFDIPANPAGTSLVGARLRVRTTTLASAGSANAATVHLAADSWSESTTTYPTRPTVGTGVLGTLSGPSAANTGYWITLDVGALSQAQGSTSLALKGTGTDSLWIWSRENTTEANRPVLELTYV